MIKRPIIIACIGYILGIILGLYFNKSIALFLGYIFIIALIAYQYYKICRGVQSCFTRTFHDFFKNIKRCIKLFFPKKAILIFCIFIIVGCSYINFLNRKYDKIYNIDETISIKGVIIKVQEHSNKYVVKVKEINGKKYRGINFLMYVKKNQKVLSYGDYIETDAEYEKPEESRNYGGFSYRNYLKQSNIYGVITPKSNIKIIDSNKCNLVSTTVNKVKENIIKKVEHNLEEETANVFLGILLGEKEQLSNEINTYFKDSNMAHILAVSGAHISYVILTVSIILNKTGKRFSRIITIAILIFFMALTNFTPSVVRASIMAIIALVSKLIYRKSDTYNNLAISCFIILLVNPYNLFNIGFQLSFLGTLGIIILSDNNKSHNVKEYIATVIKISISVQLFIIPIMILNFNVLSFNFLISGIIATPIFAGIMIIGIIVLLTGFVGEYLFPVIKLLVNLLISISKFISNIPFSKFVLKTPNIIWIISYYIVLILFILLKSKKRVKDKQKINKLLRNTVIILLAICIVVQFVQDFNFGELRIYFIDVGQGDSCLIVTPHNKTILMDGGGNSNSDYDVGKNILVPYLLDRRIKSIDYMIVSHFDSDHCKGLIYVLEVLKVKNIIIAPQCDKSNEYKEFMQIAKKKKTNIIAVKKGDLISIEKDIKIQILYPNSNLNFDDLNNNAMVAKLKYKNFNMLFTGDIEESAEQEILKMYDENILKSTILKVAHHGSKTSSTQEFLEAVKPKIALIGVGKNNKFGHPNGQVLERLKNIGAKIYRTDHNGEIMIKVNNEGKITTLTKL